jgi:diacylglycerol kinase (ATP)
VLWFGDVLAQSLSSVNEGPTSFKSRDGFRRLANAMRYSVAGLRYALKNEASIRQELLALAVLTPVSLFLHVGRLEHLILIVSMLLVVMVEFLNSAIEAAVDRISLEAHPLAGQAKDLGSAAVLVSLLIWGACWAAIVGPQVVGAIRG